jgi:hypothetical protein
VPGGAFVTCAGCGLVFDAQAGERTTEVSQHPRVRPVPARPPRLRVRETEQGLELRWRTPIAAGIVLFVFPAAPTLAFGAWFAQRHLGIGLCFVALGLGLALLAIVNVVGRRTLRVEPDAITVRFGPLLHSTYDTRIERAQLRQIYVRRDQRRFGFDLMATFPDRQCWLTRVLDLDLARAIEERLERHLHIVDHAVRDEVPLDEAQ